MSKARLWEEVLEAARKPSNCEALSMSARANGGFPDPAQDNAGAADAA